MVGVLDDVFVDGSVYIIQYVKGYSNITYSNIEEEIEKAFRNAKSLTSN